MLKTMIKKPRRNILLASILCLCLGFSSCATVQQYETPANARIATSLICTNVINFAVEPADRADVAADLYAVATVFNQFSAGHVPTPAELQAAMQLVAPKHADEWVTLTTDISAIWAAVYPNVHGNSHLALEYLAAISLGCQDAASAFLPHSAASLRPAEKQFIEAAVVAYCVVRPYLELAQVQAGKP